MADSAAACAMADCAQNGATMAAAIIKYFFITVPRNGCHYSQSARDISSRRPGVLKIPGLRQPRFIARFASIRKSHDTYSVKSTLLRADLRLDFAGKMKHYSRQWEGIMRIGSRTSSAITAAVLLSISCPAIAEGETIASAVDASDSIAATPRITVGFDTVAGERRYADRTAGDGITVVHFSSVMPRTGDSIGDLPNAFPVSAARISSGFGSRIHPVSGRWSNHAGIDLAVATGTAVAATASGVVSFSGWSGAYGYLVVVNHGDGLQTYYGHLSRLAVSRGDSLGAGDLVGLSGSTGRSTGPHLHYEVRRNGVPIDPMAS